MKPISEQRWFVAIALPYREDGRFFERDAGLLSLGFRELGMDARFLALGEPQEAADHPLILARLEQWKNPEWWRQWNLDGVVLCAWALKQYEPVARAIKNAGITLVVKLDSDGGRNARVAFWRSLVTTRFSIMDGGRRFALLQALVRCSWSYFFPRQHGKGSVEHMEHADVITIESLIAKQRFARSCEWAGAPHLANKIVIIGHPVTPEIRYDPAVAKQRLIVAVGGWNRVIKDPGLLVRTLAEALRREPDYRARIIGPGGEVIEKLVAPLPQDIRCRIEIAGPIPHHQLYRHYQEAQIIINTSWAEGAPNAAAEALCCGCSVVGHALIASMHFFTANNSGTLSCDRTLYNYVDALRAEINAWRLGWRDPQAISKVWLELAPAAKVAQAIVEAANRVKEIEKGHHSL